MQNHVCTLDTVTGNLAVNSVFITFRSMGDMIFFSFFDTLLFFTKLPFPSPWWSKELLVENLQVAGGQLRNFGPVLNVQQESLGKYCWCSRSLIIDLPQTRATSVWQGTIYRWIQWVKHACTSYAPYRRTCKECMWLWLWTASFGLGSQRETVSKIKYTNRPHGSGEEQDSKLGNSLTLAFLVWKRVIGHDLIQLEVVRMTMYEENSMKFLCPGGIRNSRKHVFLASEKR